ncbi:MAG TPA: DNA/RNA nuclease SfsA, partial [Gammaproteobacteria bacterium]|nr:DNA/RNA nuclease SfsA [Gammaproteobacteria bacterium]
MRFATPLVEGELIRRYKRFLADVRLPDGEVITAHTPNTGSMLGCAEPGSRVWIRDSSNPKRKYPWSWEISETAGGVKVGINTLLSNHLVREEIETGAIPELGGYDTIRSEVSYGSGRSRIDLLLEKEDRPNCYVEVK